MTNPAASNSDPSLALPHTAIERVHKLLAGGTRRLVGLVGAPGAGKSTAAAALQQVFGSRSVVVPMDGFHLAGSELKLLGRAGRKGAPDTFDAAGYAALLRRLREPVIGETVYAPEYRREIEEAVAGAIAVPAEVQLVITEGNYLLLDDGGWQQVRPLLDECWYMDVDETLRRERLLERHIRFGRTPQSAAAWVESTDEPNARRIVATRERADWLLPWR